MADDTRSPWERFQAFAVPAFFIALVGGTGLCVVVALVGALGPGELFEPVSSDLGKSEKVPSAVPASPAAELADAAPAQSSPVVSRWSCHWDPTMNEDWHDDVLCMSGDQRDRPYLLPEWGYVTQADIMTEAQNYEDWLNSQIAPSENEELPREDVEGPTLEAFRQAVE